MSFLESVSVPFLQISQLYWEDERESPFNAVVYMFSRNIVRYILYI